MSNMLTLEKFEEASEMVKKVTSETKLIYSEYLSNQTGNKVYLKPENMQLTGAYKLRGAYYKISTLSPEEREKGLITASAGNHAQGVAYAAKKYGVKAVIVMPTTTPLMKVNRTKGYGAEVILKGDVYDEACEYAYQLADCIQFAPAGSTPITFILGLSSLASVDTPVASPPPPIGTRIMSTSGSSLKISMAIVPCPVATARSSNGWMRAGRGKLYAGVTEFGRSGHTSQGKYDSGRHGSKNARKEYFSLYQGKYR